MTEIDTDKLRALDEAAPSGPWLASELSQRVHTGDDVTIARCEPHSTDAAKASAELFALLRNSVPAILAMAEELKSRRNENLTLARENSDLRVDVAVMRKNDCNEVKALKSDIERHLSALSAEAEENRRLREALRSIANLQRHSREDDAENAQMMENIATRALGKDKA